MLVLKRKEGQAIDVGENVRIKLEEVSGGQVKLAIVAPRNVRILRTEAAEAIERENRLAASSAGAARLEELGELRETRLGRKS
jgi:carbon storage regulator